MVILFSKDVIINLIGFPVVFYYQLSPYDPPLIGPKLTQLFMKHETTQKMQKVNNKNSEMHGKNAMKMI